MCIIRELGHTLAVLWTVPRGQFGDTLEVILGLLCDYFEGTLRVVWSNYEGPLGHFEGTVGSLMGYPGVTLSVPLSRFEGTLGSLWENSGIT